MNQGKPTKPKWWSRPRAHGPETGPFDASPTGPSAPAAGPTAGDVRSAGGTGRADGTDGDFELERPMAATATPAASSAAATPAVPPAAVPVAVQAGPRAPGTPEGAARGAGPGAPAGPEVPAADTSGSGSGSRGGISPDGPYEQEAGAVGYDVRPGHDAQVGEAARVGRDARGGQAVRSGQAARSGQEAPDGPHAEGEPMARDVRGPAARDVRESGARDLRDVQDAQDAQPPADRPRPLHAPDPYGTPPYGEPGPWAPAPPVQHPATTAAHGTPAQTAAAHGTPTQTAPAHSPHAQAAPGAPVQAAAAHGAPAQAAPVPAADPFAPPASAVPPASSVPLAQPHQVTDPARPVPPAASGPWQRYDPWAAAPLQQNGALAESTGQRRGRVRRALVGGAALVALVAGGVGGVVGAYLERHGGIDAVELPQAGAEPTDRAPGSVAGIAARSLPGVVTLHVRGADAEGTGTGFVLDTRGHILTNNHVVEPAGADGTISVTFSGGETAEGEVVGRDSGYDLAVVKVDGVGGLTALPLGNSDNVRVGDPVVAIGAPFDLADTVTSGIISAKDRPITAGGEEGDGSDVSYVDALQTDAPINPGNSGGPLLDAQARVIGINSAIRSAGDGPDLDGGQAGSIGLGFAIPINQGKRVAEELINTGRATHPVIGVTLDMDYTGDGARVGSQGNDGGPPVTEDGPGDRAGIRAGDVITGIDGQRVHSGEELIVKTRAHRPGDRLELTIRRDGEEKEVTLVLGTAEGD
ncbi:S1C family serine protease [Streptomyces minutiscleroticus]|uniref:S1C family serine protease n=1 Tax=Streptomyces minutiscleroticus TaxID=68238 RepID=UPI0033292902